MRRECGECTLCCRLLPVPQLDKPAGARCPHQRHSCGCAIYADRPNSCRLWVCRWLINDDTGDLRRPDRSHYVIDIMPDYVTITDNATGEQQHVGVVQIWVDERHPGAHRDPALRAFLERNKMPGLVRANNNKAAVILSPPCCSDDGQWHEIVPTMGQKDHGAEDVAEKLGLDVFTLKAEL